MYSCTSAPSSSRPQDPTNFPYKQEEVLINNAKSRIQLAGTLTIPPINKFSKIVILITGSGPQNRNEEALNHRPFLVWSDWLTRHGIAVLRFDDRGVGKSTGNFLTATTFDFADDVEAAVSFIRSRPDLNQLSIGLIGQSEGGLIAPMVASRNNDVKFIVLLAGDGIPIYQVGLQQLEDLNRVAGLSEPIINQKLALDKKLYDLTLRDSSLSIGELKNDIDSLLQQEMLSQHWDKSKLKALKKRYDHLATPWQRTFLKLKPADYLAKVKCPVLALNGTKDLIVNYQANLAGIAKALDQGGNKQYKTVALVGLNHFFQKSETGSMTEFTQIPETVHPIALTTVSTWINALSL
ncbi:hypothetical protein N824_08255 [Pedobacter sp. V48]|nr:hypothetical protein N824_08255 [Pedobacter sp. V48]